MLTALIPRLQSGLLTAGAVLLVLAGAYASGSRAARRAAELAQQRQRMASMERAREIEQTIDALDDDGVRERAARWVRGSASDR